MRRKVLWITETAVMLAALIVLQASTKAAGQLVTGSCVNGVLALSALLGGLWSGLAVAVLSPWIAFLFGIGPQLIPIVPLICVGNSVFVLLLWALAGKGSARKRAAGMAAAAIAKFLTLYLLVVQVLCRVVPLKPPQIAAFSAMFSWPQLVTALIGGTVALLITPTLRKALHKSSGL